MTTDERIFYNQLQKKVFQTSVCSVLDVRAVCWSIGTDPVTSTGTGFAVYRVSDSGTTLLRIEDEEGVVIADAYITACP